MIYLFYVSAFVKYFVTPILKSKTWWLLLVYEKTDLIILPSFH